MKRLIRFSSFLMVVCLIIGPSLVQAFNPATHIYIADKVFRNCRPKIDLYYGSIAPDLALYVPDPEKWPTAFDDTHYNYINLSSYALRFSQKAFALGWLTHNEEWGADHYAHIEYPLGGDKGYVIEKAELLSSQTGMDPEFAHYAIEAGIDLLLKNDDPKLGEKLLKANLLRSRQDRQLLVEVLVRKESRTDRLTLAGAELIFRNLVGQYAEALALSSPKDKEALAELGAQLALEMYGIEILPEEVLDLLNIAIGLCEQDYKTVIDYTIEQIITYSLR